MEFSLQRDYLLGQHRSDVTRQRKATATTAEVFVLQHAFSTLQRQKRRRESPPIRTFRQRPGSLHWRSWSRLIAKVPHRHWQTTTLLAALRHDGIDAPWLLEGPINGESFQTYVEKVLLPTLRPGDIVIMDNLGSHKSKIVRQLIRTVGAKLLFLPKYSPDLNPIEQIFAKLKHLLRKAAARTVETGCAAVAELLGAFTKNECANYFKNSGYAAN